MICLANLHNESFVSELTSQDLTTMTLLRLLGMALDESESIPTCCMDCGQRKKKEKRLLL